MQAVHIIDQTDSTSMQLDTGYMNQYYGLMLMAYIAAAAGFEPTALAFWVSEIIITPHRLPNAITLSTPTYRYYYNSLIL